MTFNFGLLSHATSALTFLLLAVLIARRYLRRDSDRLLFVASSISAIWSFALALQSFSGHPPFLARLLLELARDASWIALLFLLIKNSKGANDTSRKLIRRTAFAVASILLALITCLLLEYFLAIQLFGGRTKLIGLIALSLIGLVLIEQIWRNAAIYGRSSIKYVCVSIGALFAYDFFLYADALLFNEISIPLWDARGGLNALLAPLLATNMINTRKQPIEIQFSRNVVFHAGTLFVAGSYLLVIAAGGYYVKIAGGSWGGALQALLISALLVLFVLLLLSNQFRARLMLFISKNFFNYKYDYRDEWLKITQAFSNLSETPPLEERVIRILGDLVESNSGALWLRNEDGHFVLSSTVNMPTPKRPQIDADADLLTLMRERDWIVDIEEYQIDPVRYNLVEMPEPIQELRNAWLIIPLYLADEIYGMAVIGHSYAPIELNWENYDLIRVVARQAATFLAQANAQNQLSQAMQFDAVSRTSAFLVHDLKTVIAQLSLLVKNADKHRSNPAFIDDMILTTEHAVAKMTNLVDHIKRPVQEQPLQEIDVVALVKDLVAQHQRQKPEPTFDAPDVSVMIKADPEQLRSVIGHLIRNAQDATPPDGEVTVAIKTGADHLVLFVLDTGCGMSESFLKNQLFKPFESTKGLAGMGIGVFQARDYIRKLGGNIDVTSELGVGSCFSVRIPTIRKQPQRQKKTALIAFQNAQNS